MDRIAWADRFGAQSISCADLGSDLYARLMSLLADDVRSGGVTWKMLVGVRGVAGLRFGDAVPLRLAAAAHLLALDGAAPQWAAVLPSCGGTVPRDDAALWDVWTSMAALHHDELAEGLLHDVQTNEVGRSAGLGYALSRSGMDRTRLIEIGCSGALNLRLDRYRIDLGDRVIGDPGSALVVRPEIRGAGCDGRPEAVGSARLPRVVGRVGIDPEPIDVTNKQGRTRLESFVWPDQGSRMEQLRSAMALAGQVPVHLIRTGETASALESVLAEQGPRSVMHSIVWQYIPTDLRREITAVIEEAGARATSNSPLAWIRYEPDEWNRARAAIWLRTWPQGGDRLVAHADYHGRWLQPI